MATGMTFSSCYLSNLLPNRKNREKDYMPVTLTFGARFDANWIIAIWYCLDYNCSRNEMQEEQKSPKPSRRDRAWKSSRPITLVIHTNYTQKRLDLPQVVVQPNYVLCTFSAFRVWQMHILCSSCSLKNISQLPDSAYIQSWIGITTAYQ